MGSATAHAGRIHLRRATPAQIQDRVRTWAILVREFLQRWIPRDATVVDLGAGDGVFISHVRAARRIAVDVSAAQRGLIAPDVEFIESCATRIDALADGCADVVFTSNMLEHLPTKQDVAEAVCECRRILRVGGEFIAMGPNIRVLHGAYWDFWDHHTPLTDRALCDLLELNGFEIVRAVPRFMPFSVFSRLPRSAWLVRGYLRLPIAWRLFGRQFLVRARKLD